MNNNKFIYMDGLQQPWNRFYHCHPSQIYDKMRWDFSKIQSRRTHSISYSKFPRLVSVKKLIDDFWSNKQSNENMEYFFETKRNEMKKKTRNRGLRRSLQSIRAANDLGTLISTKRIEKRFASFRNTNDNQEIGNIGMEHDDKILIFQFKTKWRRFEHFFLCEFVHEEVGRRSGEMKVKNKQKSTDQCWKSMEIRN